MWRAGRVGRGPEFGVRVPEEREERLLLGLVVELVEEALVVFRFGPLPEFGVLLPVELVDVRLESEVGDTGCSAYPES